MERAQSADSSVMQDPVDPNSMPRSVPLELSPSRELNDLKLTN